MSTDKQTADVNGTSPQQQSSSIGSNDDTVLAVPAYDVPFSYYMSDEAKQCSLNMMNNPHNWEVEGDDVQAYRDMWDKQYYAQRLRRAEKLYPTDSERQSIAGVAVDIITPKDRAPANDERVLINLHGGAFMIGATMGGLIESIPVAHTAGIKVISVDYRQGPEYKFPAATEDVIAVYRALLNDYEPNNIGIFGCSAGGLLTAQVVSALVDNAIAVPAAVGILCSPADCRFDGDSRYFVPPLVGEPAPAPGDVGIGHMAYYLSDVDPDDPLVSPVESPDRLACFPPTMLVTGIRAGELSSVVHTHSRLINAGVDARLHIWDGMWHGFFYDVQLPESREFFAALASFFAKHLGSE